MATEKKFLRDSAALRWGALMLIALTMFAVYLVNDEFSPLKTFLEAHNQWNSVAYGWFQSSYSLFNVFLFMLIIGGLVLDKLGVRFTGILSCILCVIGIGVKYWALSTTSLTGNVLFMGCDLPQRDFNAFPDSTLFRSGVVI